MSVNPRMTAIGPCTERGTVPRMMAAPPTAWAHVVSVHLSVATVAPLAYATVTSKDRVSESRGVMIKAIAVVPCPALELADPALPVSVGSLPAK